MDQKKTVIITGGNSGLGYKCAQDIAKSAEYRVILAGLDLKDVVPARDKLAQESGNPDIMAMQIDMSSTVSVRNFVAEYKKLNLPLYGLVCNAGINGMQTKLTPEGFDMVFATNYLGNFLLVNLMLPCMQPTGRIAIVSSDMHCPPGPPLTWPGAEALAHPAQTEAADTRYSFSKLCVLYLTYELTARLARIGSGVTMTALNPGLMRETGFAPMDNLTPEIEKIVEASLGSPEKSGVALAQMITESSLAGKSGKYFDRSAFNEKESSPLSYSKENALELWNKSVDYTKLQPEETLKGLL